MSSNQTLYQALGEDGIRAICNAFYEIMDRLPEAADIRRLHAEDLTPMKEKLGDYLVDRMGGSPLYADKHGTECMTTPHEHYATGPRERDQWLLCMDKALDTVAVEAEVREMLKDPLYRLADAVRNREQSLTNDNPDVIAIV
ncbi:MAG: group II truncated hemoglobin [Gammaproteobacteria bacterium]|nr:group II truncated hemoglobin [Gammaproteobacteria bacterium]